MENGCRKWIRDYSVRIRDIWLIQLRVKSIRETEQGKHAIMHRSHVAEKIKNVVLPWSDRFLKLLIAQV